MKSHEKPERLGLARVVGQSLSIGPLIDIALAVGGLVLLFRSSKFQPLWRWFVFPAATVDPVLALYGTLVPFPSWPERFGLLAGLAAIATTAIWLVVLKHRKLV